MKSINELLGLFNKHPNEVGMSYFGHFLYSSTVTFRLFVYAFACLIHTFFPFLFTHTISEFVSRLHEEFNAHLPYYVNSEED